MSKNSMGKASSLKSTGSGRLLILVGAIIVIGLPDNVQVSFQTMANKSSY